MLKDDNAAKAILHSQEIDLLLKLFCYFLFFTPSDSLDLSACCKIVRNNLFMHLLYMYTYLN